MIKRSIAISIFVLLFGIFLFPLNVNAKTASPIIKQVDCMVENAKESADWESVGNCRITHYCPVCNDPSGSYQSSSGKTLREGYVACNWLENGTEIKINDKEYVVMDTCGTEAIDVFQDTGDECCCTANYYAEVKIKKNKKEETNYVSGS